ncbi:SGNH/GDSL hydrolase family protein [Nonomuraea spiralis]|uniref:SGNH/GDSL hydrolase family protein n=1 Tax=Nonomuraea TaxID=83681 RepID=UPI00163CDC90|nr:SGNH/GDSL hydrolase family protein [Nonomuraea sp. WAC 01424]
MAVTPPQRAPQTVPPARTAAPVMMFVGDSFTVGSGPVPPWRTYASESARLLGWQPVIAGAGGTGYLNKGKVGRTFRRSFEEELAWRPPPDVLVISGGHNDQRWSTTQVGRAAAELLAEIRHRWPVTRVFVIGPIWLEDTPSKAYRVRDALAEAAEAAGVPFLDPMRKRWVTDRPSETVLPDGVHPTLAGHERIAAWLAAELL